MTAVALIAAYNESARIAATVRAALSIPALHSVLVVDDGSTDDTARLAAAAGAAVLQLQHNVGKGAALEAGLTALEEFSDLKAVLLLDGDLQGSAAAAGLLLDALEASEQADNLTGGRFSLTGGRFSWQVQPGDGIIAATAAADMVIGVLPTPAKSGGFGWVKRLATTAISEELRQSSSQVSPNFPLAPLSGQRAIRFTALHLLRPLASGYATETIMTIRALRAGLKIREVPVPLSHAATGRTLKGFLHRARQYADIRKALRSF